LNVGGGSGNALAPCDPGLQAPSAGAAPLLRPGRHMARPADPTGISGDTTAGRPTGGLASYGPHAEAAQAHRGAHPQLPVGELLKPATRANSQITVEAQVIWAPAEPGRRARNWPSGPDLQPEFSALLPGSLPDQAPDSVPRNWSASGRRPWSAATRLAARGSLVPPDHRPSSAQRAGLRFSCGRSLAPPRRNDLRAAGPRAQSLPALGNPPLEVERLRRKPCAFCEQVSGPGGNTCC